jgi:hypothetical protein
MYARRLTKDELMKSGITTVTKDGRVFREDGEIKPTINNQGYYMINLYELDDEGNRILIPHEKSVFGYIYKTRSVGLHRIMYAWYSKEHEVPEGMVVDHINNEHDKIEDYYMTNLQLLTPAENVAKDRDNCYVYEIKCNLNKPRSYYEDKLRGYEVAYEQAKKDKDVEGAHKLRSYISQTRARLRYYDKHIEEARVKQKAKEIEEAYKREYHERAQKKKELKAKVDSSRNYYLQVLEAYGKDDEYVKKMWGEWKLAIAMYHGFCAKIKSDSNI